MKYLFVIIGLLVFSSCKESPELKKEDNTENTEDEADNVDEKIIILSGDQWPNKCSRKAVKISSSQVQFDDCYSERGKFKMDKSIPLKDADLLHTIYNMSGENWQLIKTAIDSVDYCDSAVPFTIQIILNGKKEIISLPRISNCYPEPGKELMDKIEDFFDNWKLD